ncbi:MAG: hypothetical protein HY040_08100 [Planctomycetes bacterium]|nr:hypothetical protein [Planctomycetota bacterium]
MDQKSSWLLLGFASVVAAVLAVGGARQSADKDHKEAKAAKAQETSDNKDATASKGPLGPIHDFFRAQLWNADGVEQQKTLSEADWYVWGELSGPLSKIPLDFLIATVPDPRDSGQAFQFDQVLEGIQRALERDDFVVDRSWLPWSAATKEEAAKRWHERHPGTVLFRRVTKNQIELLAVLLVGEKATTGIQTEAFLNSVKLLKGYVEVLEVEKKETTLRILGPYSSGSIPSLTLALERILKDRKEERAKDRPTIADITMVCGSAHGFKQKEFVDKIEKLAERHGAGKPAVFDFQTVMHDNKPVMEGILCFLKNPSKPVAGDCLTDEILLLHESNTDFGRSFSKAKKGSGSPCDPNFVYVPFPIHISQLRTIHTKEQAARMEKLGLPRATSNLPFPRDDEIEIGSQVVPVQGPLMTTAVNDLVLSNLLTTLSQKRPKYVGIVATDARDVIFLAGLVRDRYPEVQLFTTTTDLLFTHPDYTYALKGMVIGSTYPLYPGVQGWSVSPDNKHRLVFSRQSNQAYYNGVLAHRQQINTERGRAEPPIPEQAMLDYGLIFKNLAPERFPGIWITAVGQNGQFAPVHYIKAHDLEKPDHAHHGEGHKADDCTTYMFKKSQEAQQQIAESEATDVRLELAHPGSRILPNFFGLLLLAALLTMFALGRQAFLWIRIRFEDPKPGVHSDPAEMERLDAFTGHLKQRIDFAMGGMAMMLLLGWLLWVLEVPIVAWCQENDREWLSAVLFACAFALVGGVLACVVLLPLFQKVEGCRDSRWWKVWLDDASAILGFPKNCRELWAKIAKEKKDATKVERARVAWDIYFSRIPLVAMYFLFLTGNVLLFGFVLSWLWPWSGNVLGMRALLTFERTAHAGNGLSPLIPVAFLCAAFASWGFFLVKKIYLASCFRVACPFPANQETSPVGGDYATRLGQLATLHEQIHDEIMPPSTWRKHPSACLLLVLVLAVLYTRFLNLLAPPLDGFLFGVLTLSAFFGAAFLLSFTLIQVYLAWRKLKQLMKSIVLLPMTGAFSRLPEKVVSIFGHYLTNLRPRRAHLSLSVQQVETLLALYPEACSRMRTLVYDDESLGPVSNAKLAQASVELAKLPSQGLTSLVSDFHKELNSKDDEQVHGTTDSRLTALTSRLLGVLPLFWPAHSMDEAFGGGAGGDDKAKSKTFLGLPLKDPLGKWVQAAEDLTAMETVRYISQFFVQLRNLLFSMTLGSLLLVFAAASYPFRPQALLLFFLTGMVAMVTVFVIVFLFQMNGDELVSRITRTTPNRITWDPGFFKAIMVYVLPIVGALLVQIPLLSSVVRQLLEPLTHLLR